MALVRMDIRTIVVGGGPVASLLVLRPHDATNDQTDLQLPIKIGPIEAMSISMGVSDGTQPAGRPMTHDLLASTISALGGKLQSVVISSVSGTTFFAQLRIHKADGDTTFVDCRPSDAIALAVRTGTPIYATQEVLGTASYPDFRAVEKDEQAHELEEFHEFVQNLSPDDFSRPGSTGQDGAE